MSHKLLTLPNESFVSIQTQRLASPVMAWTNQDLITEKSAVGYAYCMPQAYESPDLYLPEDRVQSADRYGGYGVGHAGGSGRCANLGTMQVKGVGPTPLVTQIEDIHHSSGTMTLHEAGREAIWSRILPVFLPYGVVPSLAIVLTQGIFPERDPDGVDIPRQRSLLLREFAVRPAHFMRNLHFKTPVCQTSGLRGDTLRTQAAMAYLHLALEQAYGNQISGVSGIQQINLGLSLMAKRFAAQVAAAFAKRIFHASLGCSNIALDGRYIDFGTMTFVDRYRRRAFAKGWADQWTQQYSLNRTLVVLHFHIKKYLQANDINRLIPEEELVMEFRRAYFERLEIEMLKLTGVPETVVESYPIAARNKLFRCIYLIYSRGAGEVFNTWPAETETIGANPQPEQDGRYDLNQILALAATCSEVSQLEQVLSEHLDDANLRKEFITHYLKFIDWSVSKVGKRLQPTARVYTAMQALRLNADLSFLDRDTLYEQLTAFDAKPEGVGQYIDQIIEQGLYYLDPEHPDLPNGGVKRQLSGLRELGEKLPEFALSRVPQSPVSDSAIIGLRKLCHACTTIIH
ncbi:MAG: hypothetical protein ABL903_17500 [Methylococcales bacterium]